LTRRSTVFTVYTMTFYLKTALLSLFFGDSGREYRTRNSLRVFFGGFIPKYIYPRVTGILIPISTHPTVQCTVVWEQKPDQYISYSR
jgi:hypothetical protein